MGDAVDGTGRAPLNVEVPPVAAPVKKIDENGGAGFDRASMVSSPAHRKMVAMRRAPAGISMAVLVSRNVTCMPFCWAGWHCAGDL